MSIPFYVLDVFAEQKYAGNPLAVVRRAAPLSPERMQAIAREMNYSETTFIAADVPRDGGYDVRIFTPTAEIPFAGHPTLGTAWAIGHEIGAGTEREIRLHLGIGTVPVRFEPGRDDGAQTVWMSPGAPVFGRRAEAAEIAAVLSLSTGDIDPRAPVCAMSIGLSFLLVPVRDRDALGRSRIDPARYQAMIAAGLPAGLLVFAADPRQPANHLSARMYAPALGVAEDPATGSAGTCLGAYLGRYPYFGDLPAEVRVEQGHEMGRPSLVRLRPGGASVEVGGGVILVARGELV